MNKIVMLEKHDTKLFTILDKLKAPVFTIKHDDVDFLVDGYVSDKNIVVIDDKYFRSNCSENLHKICEGLGILKTPSQIMSEFSMNDINTLTFGEVEYIRGLDKPSIRIAPTVNDDIMDAIGYITLHNKG